MSDMLTKLINLIFISFSFVNTQLSPGYVCVQKDKCQPITGVGIDPIILTTTKKRCPNDQIPCITLLSQLYTTCGTRTVTGNVDLNDGNAQKGVWPWVAYIKNQTGFCGGGVLINSNTVLTAAHKVYGNRNTPNLLEVYMGVHTSNVLGARLDIRNITIHPNFKMDTLINDIAVITLSAAIATLPQAQVNTICPPTVAMSFVGQRCAVAGWGQTSFTAQDAPVVQQKQVHVKIVNYNTCHQSMSAVLGSNVDIYLDPKGEVCAGGETNKDMCTYDGGSPLVCHVNNSHYVLAGLVIWGKGCGEPGRYGVYVNIPNYIPWIQSITTI